MIPPAVIIKAAGALMGKFMGGGASYVIIGLTAYSGFLGWQLSQVKDGRDKLETKLEAAQKTINGTSTALATQAAQNNRQNGLSAAEMLALEKINAQKESYGCAKSEPIVASLDWLREYDAGNQPNHDNAANVPLQSQARDAK